jgi:hypothetical protein
MTLLQYKESLKKLKAEYQYMMDRLDECYALANNPFKVGDVFTDHIGKIRIEKIKITVTYGTPSCVYIGTNLKKDGTPYKDGSKREAYQINYGK